VLHMQGALLLQAGKAEQAVAPLKQAHEAMPDHAGFAANYGIALVETGAPETAEPVLRHAAGLTPPNPQAVLNLALLVKRRGDVDEAEDLLARATTLAPGYARGWLELGVLAASRGANDDAMACFERVLSVEPGHPGALFNMAMANLAGHRFDAALEQFQACRDGLADNPDVYLGLGLCLQELGRVDEALAVYRDLLKKTPGVYATVLKNLTSASSGTVSLKPSRMRERLGF